MNNNILLCAVNAKFIHSNLAVRYLRKYCESPDKQIAVAEFSINDSMGNILKALYSSAADIYGFSCYIWNIRMVLDICSSLRKVRPGAVIILGGPEVSYDPRSLMEAHEFIDYLVIGEGEATLLELLSSMSAGCVEPGSIDGIAYRKDSEIMINRPRPLITDMDTLPFPYEGFRELNNRIIYYETSRGCPFNCQYCLSSTVHGVRYLSMKRIKEDISHFAAAGVKQVKLVDRTFNCNVDRAVEIMEYIIGLGTDTNFHFELAGDLVNQRFLHTVRKAPEGLFQFEIGIQSTNPLTLSEIKRTMDFGKVGSNVRSLISYGNTHIHLDLIAGLPHESLDSFRKSFNDVYAIGPDMLQLGFLKLLKGSGIREASARYGMDYHVFPPYEVISTKWLSFEELLLLKDIEQILEYYHNSGRFRHTLGFLLKASVREPFDFFLELSHYWNQKGYFGSSRNVNDLYIILVQFAREMLSDRLKPSQLKLLNEYMKLDWLLYAGSGSMPEAIDRFDHTPIKNSIQEYLKKHPANLEGFSGLENATLRQLLKQVAYEVFPVDIFGKENNEEVVLFLPLKQGSGVKKPRYTVVPLKEILQSS